MFCKLSSEDVLIYHSQARNGICLLVWGFKNLRIHWSLWRILKTSNKSVRSNNFWYLKVDIFWNFIQYIGWDKTLRWNTNVFFSFTRSNSFTFNPQFLHELNHKVHLSKNMYGIFGFQFCLVLIKVCSTKSMECLTLKCHNHFSNQSNRKATHSLLPDVWFLSCNKKFENSLASTWVGTPQMLAQRWTF